MGGTAGNRLYRQANHMMVRKVKINSYEKFCFLASVGRTFALMRKPPSPFHLEFKMHTVDFGAFGVRF